MNARRVVALFVMIACAAQAALALAQSAAAPARGATAPPACAVVGTRRIPAAELDRRTAQAVAEYSRRSGSATLPAEMRELIRRQVLESLIRQELLSLEATRLGVSASTAEAEAILKQEAFFNPGGRFDEQRFLAVQTTQKPQFDAAIALIRGQLAGRKLGEQLQSRFQPAESKVRQQAVRSLSRVTAEHFTLRRADFDGSFAEPREADVLAHYRAHQDDFLRTDRAKLTIAFVNTPGLTDEERQVPGALEAWNRRMKAVADSVLGEIARGADFESAAAFLSPRPGIVVATDNFPGYWRGTPAQEKKVFDARNAGKVVPEAIAGEEGWLLVKVTELVPAHAAPLHEVAREIRGVLRRDRKLHAEDYALRELYARLADSLAAPGIRVRWAVFDTSRIRVSEPTAAELDRYYRGHLADYSAFDAASGGVVARPLAEVQADVRAGILRDARVSAARLGADRVERAWQSGKRDAAAEAQGEVREVTSARGTDFDSTRIGAVLADTVWAREHAKGGAFRSGGAWVVWQPLARVERVVPSFGQARSALLAAQQAQRQAEELAGAKRMFDQDAMQFSRGNVISYRRLAVTAPPMLQVPLTRDEVESYHRTNIAKYSAPELVRAKHILVEPKSRDARDEARARKLADSLLAVARAGGNFDALAKAFSDDIATRDKGGDLGVFARGTMLTEFELAAFALQAGEFAPEPVRTEVGFHVILVTEHAPEVVQPLAWIYASVSSDAALEKAERMAKATADSLVRTSRTSAELLRACAGRGYDVARSEFKVGTPATASFSRPMFEGLERARPGQLLPPLGVKGQGYWIAWVDSISPPRVPSWDEARPLAIEAYRSGGGSRAMQAKRAELDSLEASGWSVDSLAALWGGFDRTKELGPGKGVPVLGSIAMFDSLAFGTDRSPALEVDRCSPWVTFPNGLSRIRVVERTTPPSTQLGEHVANLRAAETETALRDWFDDARRRHPVKILEARMREVQLVAPPTEATAP